ncbi:MAG: TetR/AcrR family transcriptional regulator [Bacteriovoracia bacterium]
MPKKKRAYHHGDLRNTLMAAAVQLMNERQSVNFGIKDICDVAGVVPAAAYRHFSSKNAILAEIAGEGFVKFHASLASASAKPANQPLRRLSALFSAYVEFALAHPILYQIMFQYDVGNFLEFPHVLMSAQKGFNVLNDLVKECAEAGLLRDRQVNEISMSLWSASHGLSVLLMGGRLQTTCGFSPADAKAAATRVSRDLIQGLLK